MQRTAEKNKQVMKYSLLLREDTDYVLDDDGNKIIDGYDSDGNPYYREAGTKTPVYGEPVEFKASISSSLNELHAREYGVDASSIYVEIQCRKGYLPLKYGSKIWKTSSIVWKDEDNGIPDVTSSDYTVVGILDEFIENDWFLIRRND